MPEHATGRIGLLILAFLFLALGVWAGDQATVIAEKAPLHAEPGASAAVVKTLQQGDVVEIGLAFAEADGEWCAVREAGQKATLGWARCEQLEREQKPQAFLIVPAPVPGGVVQPALLESAAAPGHFLHELWLWTGWPGHATESPRVFNNLFGFTAQQQAQVESLAGQMGVTGCSPQVEDFYRSYGNELTHPPLNPTPPEKQREEEMKREFHRFTYPCLMKMQELMEQLPRLMTPEQQRAHVNMLNQYNKDLAARRRSLTSPDTFPGIH